MLELRPICEHCAKALPPDSPEAVICSFECTFCSHCANEVLSGICPNCGGNFSTRPLRPKQNWHGDNFLGKYPASAKPKHRPADLAAHAALVAQLMRVPAGER